MAITFEHDQAHDHAAHDARTAWRNRYRLFRTVRHAAPAPHDSATAIMGALVIGLMFWIVGFAVILSLFPAPQ